MHDADKEVPFVTDAGVKSGDGSLLSYKKGGRGCWWWWGRQRCAPHTDARRCALGCFVSASCWFRKLKKKKTLIRDLDLVNYWEMRPECAALLSGSCCFNEQLLRTNSDSRWPIIGTALSDSTIFMYRKYFKTKPGFEIEICRGSFATAENIC